MIDNGVLYIVYCNYGIGLILIAFLLLQLLLLSLLFSIYISFSFALTQTQDIHSNTKCIRYDSRDNTIVISCGNANLTDVYNAISANNSGILNKGPDPKVWLLNANIKVENNTSFYINSTDTSWLKINSTFTGLDSTKNKDDDKIKEPNHILARGNLIIDSVKITSWDTNKNDYAISDINGTIPRSYILVNYGNGTTNITNSELAYLGYKHARSFGLTYYTGAGSIIKDNKIHDLHDGFYSDGFAGGAYNITIEGNEFYSNKLQGIAPHSSSHHLTISNNTVHNNGREGIICSIDCYNIIIESNRVSNNTHDGIVLRDNVTKSTITNNIVHNNKENQIWLDKLANNNSVYNNNISGGANGITISDASANNTITNNTIANSYSAGMYLLKGASQNTITSNTVNNSTNAVSIPDQNTTINIFRDNKLINSNAEAIKLKVDNSTNKFDNTLESAKNVSDLSPASPQCIGYDSRDNTIVISCGNANLTDVYNAISANNSGILNKGPDPKVWLLNANIKVENNTSFYINSTDTSWLKINSTFSGVLDKEPNHILARGNLIIDSVKITSWDTNKNDYAISDINGTIPRSYILVNYGNGTTNITNSELAYLGYKHARSFGLTYYTGAGSIIKDNKIHDLHDGFYSDGFAGGAYNITIEGNEFYSNKLQGIAPHSSSHHLTISNNTVHNNGREGIICSIDCYNIIIESNRVSNNTHDGIVLRDNVTKSTITNNIVHNNKENQIWLDKLANNNSVYNNNISGGANGITISDASANNTITNNTIANSYSAGMYLLKGASQNTITSNTVNNSTNAVSIPDQNTTINIFRDNKLINSNAEAIKLKVDNSTNKFDNTLESAKNVSDLSPASPQCIGYDSRDNTIVISCGNANLTDVYNAISANNSGILNKGPDPKVWLLNANIKVENNTSFYINSTDTSWLKINSTFSGVLDKEPNHILARGNLIIDSVKITSWDTNKNDYAGANGTIPRSYILVNYGNGTTNITNSELAHLGYPHARSFGLTYYTGAGSIIKDNKIHDLHDGFYSDGFAGGAYNITIEGNEFYNNTLQGIGSHSSSHHLTISNNTVHNNGREGIICSIDCYNIIIESNRVSNNTHDGIVLRDNVTKSTITNNIVHNNKENQIWLDKLANNNSVYNNNISGGANGIRVSDASANNTITNNTIANSYSAGMYLLKGASQNTITSNTVNNSTNAVSIPDQNTTINIFRDNKLINSNAEAIKLKVDNSTNKFENNTSYVEPLMRDPNLKANLVFNGLESPKDLSDLSPVSKFEFLGIDDILILEKNEGKVYRVVNGVMLKEPLLDVNVANEWDRGLLGIAVTTNENKSIPAYVFLFFTESKSSKDGADDCPTQFNCKDQNKIPLSNSIYRYELVNNKLINPKLILGLPAVPGPRHDGGDLVIGPDHNLYVSVGDIEGARTSATRTKSMNYQNGTEPDGRSGILRIILNGTSAGKGILGDYYPLNLYYGYGIRNSFGIDFDPVTGILWDTENGDHFGDEINLVLPGFNSGWKEIQGVWKISDADLFNSNPAPKYKGFNKSSDELPAVNLNLTQFVGRGQYSAPEFVWNQTVAPTAIRFLNSEIYGKKYLNDLIVGDFKLGNLYHFELNKNRTELLLKGELSDKIANNQKELEESLLGQRFGKITDLEVGPDGYLYILALNADRASIFKLIPTS